MPTLTTSGGPSPNVAKPMWVSPFRAYLGGVHAGVGTVLRIYEPAVSSNAW